MPSGVSYLCISPLFTEVSLCVTPLFTEVSLCVTPLFTEVSLCVTPLFTEVSVQHTAPTVSNSFRWKMSHVDLA